MDKCRFQVGIHVYIFKKNEEDGNDEEILVGTTAKVIYTTADISALIDDLIIDFNKTREASYIKLFPFFKIDIHIAKVNALTALLK